MPVQIDFVIEDSDGQHHPLETRLLTLSTEEQEEFKLADQRQKSYRQKVVDAGAMEIVETGYVWVDQEAAEKNKPTDPVWHNYFNRWLKETNQTFKEIRKII